MLTKIRTHYVNIVLIIAFISYAPVAGWAADPGQASQSPPGGRPSDKDRAAVLRGRVTNEAGEPLVDVRIIVTMPSADPRAVDLKARLEVREARSDAGGEYRLVFPEITGRTPILIDAMKPGYRSLKGPPMFRSEARRIEVGPGTEAEATLVLKPALHVSGIIVDEHGRPIPGAEITANAESARARGAIERTASRPDGSFELFNFPVRPPVLQGETRKGAIHFFHPDYLAHDIEDVYALVAGEREMMRIVLGTGYKVTGTVLDAAGKPARNAMIKAIRKDGTHRKATRSDANGRFTLRGLTGGLTLLSARAMEIRQSLQLPMALKGDRSDLELRLTPIPSPAALPGHDVLGMRLTDVTAELKSAYDLSGDRGVLILDPGKDPDRLKIGRLEEGDVFWMVGRTRVGGVREFVGQILAETAGQDADAYSVRVVYNFSRVDFDGARTANLRFTREDLKQLKILSDQLTPESP